MKKQVLILSIMVLAGLVAPSVQARRLASAQINEPIVPTKPTLSVDSVSQKVGIQDPHLDEWIQSIFAKYPKMNRNDLLSKLEAALELDLVQLKGNDVKLKKAKDQIKKLKAIIGYHTDRANGAGDAKKRDAISMSQTDMGLKGRDMEIQTDGQSVALQTQITPPQVQGQTDTGVQTDNNTIEHLYNSSEFSGEMKMNLLANLDQAKKEIDNLTQNLKKEKEKNIQMQINQQGGEAQEKKAWIAELDQNIKEKDNEIQQLQQQISQLQAHHIENIEDLIQSINEQKKKLNKSMDDMREENTLINRKLENMEKAMMSAIGHKIGACKLRSTSDTMRRILEECLLDPMTRVSGDADFDKFLNTGRGYIQGKNIWRENMGTISG